MHSHPLHHATLKIRFEEGRALFLRRHKKNLNTKPRRGAHAAEQVARHHEPVAAIIAGPADHGDATATKFRQKNLFDFACGSTACRFHQKLGREPIARLRELIDPATLFDRG
jgi:hypothetical protein